jgi:hypothetical protein
MSSSTGFGPLAALRRVLAIAGAAARRGRSRKTPAARPDGTSDSSQASSGSICRNPLVERILSTIHNNSILLCAEPGAGKTQLLLELRRRLLDLADPTYRFSPVYIDLRGVAEQRFFDTLAAAVRQQVSVHNPDHTICTPVAPTDFNHRDLARDLRLTVRQLGSRTPRHVKLVLLVDGIEVLESYHPRISQRLRGLFMTSLADHLVMVASAVTISRRWDREGSPWYNFFEEICLTVDQ